MNVGRAKGNILRGGLQEKRRGKDHAGGPAETCGAVRYLCRQGAPARRRGGLKERCDLQGWDGGGEWWMEARWWACLVGTDGHMDTRNTSKTPTDMTLGSRHGGRTPQTVPRQNRARGGGGGEELKRD